jgi:hypothetical protein
MNKMTVRNTEGSPPNRDCDVDDPAEIIVGVTHESGALSAKTMTLCISRRI